jgi:hypothetical protein
VSPIVLGHWPARSARTARDTRERSAAPPLTAGVLSQSTGEHTREVSGLRDTSKILRKRLPGSVSYAAGSMVGLMSAGGGIKDGAGSSWSVASQAAVK